MISLHSVSFQIEGKCDRINNHSFLNMIKMEFVFGSISHEKRSLRSNFFQNQSELGFGNKFDLYHCFSSDIEPKTNSVFIKFNVLGSISEEKQSIR